MYKITEKIYALPSQEDAGVTHYKSPCKMPYCRFTIHRGEIAVHSCAKCFAAARRVYSARFTTAELLSFPYYPRVVFQDCPNCRRETPSKYFKLILLCALCRNEAEQAAQQIPTRMLLARELPLLPEITAQIIAWL
jgi:ribosomal protein L37AE/L43A